MLNAFQKSNLRIARQGEKQKLPKLEVSDKPNIIKCFEAVMGYEYRMRRSGRAMLALCPFHGEDNPSFAMYEDTNTYFCFACGVTGDSFKFIMELLDLDFLAAKSYAQENGLYEQI